MKYSLGISSFPEEISSLSCSVVFLYFFALITEEGLPVSPCYCLELCIRMVYLSFSPLFFTSLFTAICKASSVSHFSFLHFFFLGMVLSPVSCTMSWTSVHSSSGTLSIRSSPDLVFADCIELLQIWLQRIQSIWFWCWPSGVVKLPLRSLLTFMLLFLVVISLFSTSCIS